MNPRTLPLEPRRRRDRMAASTSHTVALVFTAALALAGCANGGAVGEGATAADDASEAPATSGETVTVTSTIDPTAESDADTTTQASSQEPSPTRSECSSSSVSVATDSASIAPPFPDRSWSVTQTSNLCGSLGYVELATSGGTGSSPTQLLLYNEGKLLGTGIRCNALGQVTGSTDDSVSVQYRWPVGNDSNANMSGRADVTFQWNGSSVDMIGDLPRDAIGTAC